MSDAFSVPGIYLEIMGYNKLLYNYVCINMHILQINPNLLSSEILCSTTLIKLSPAQGKEPYAFS